MTKVIKLPISSETCRKIQVIVGTTLWILATVGIITSFVGLWFNWWNIDIYDRLLYGFFSGGSSFISILIMLIYSKKKGVWIEFVCNCKGKNK